MTPALPMLRLQAAHYAAIRARLRGPMHLQFVPVPPRRPTLTETDRIAEIIRRTRHARTPERIRTAATAVFELGADDLASPCRADRFTRPRMIAMALCRHLLSRYPTGSFPRIGAAFGGRDHSTVIHAHDRYRALVERVALSLQSEPTT